MKITKIIEKSIHLTNKCSVDEAVHGNNKLKGLHGQISDEINYELKKNGLHNKFTVHSLDKNGGKEIKYNGAFCEKKADITITSNCGGDIVSVIEIKMPMSNYSQNGHNYLENLVGQCSNAKNAGIKFYHMEFVCQDMPYFEGKDKKIVSKIEHHKAKRFNNRTGLMELNHTKTERPDALLLCFYGFQNGAQVGETKEEYMKKIVNNKIHQEHIVGVESKGDYFVNDFSGFINKVINDLVTYDKK